VITNLETEEEIDTYLVAAHFPNRFTEVRALFHLNEITFPSAGRYLFTLQVDGEWVAHRRLRVLSVGDQP